MPDMLCRVETAPPAERTPVRASPPVDGTLEDERFVVGRGEQYAIQVAASYGTAAGVPVRRPVPPCGEAPGGCARAVGCGVTAYLRDADARASL